MGPGQGGGEDGQNGQAGQKLFHFKLHKTKQAAKTQKTTWSSLENNNQMAFMVNTKYFKILKKPNYQHWLKKLTFR
jgi:hypothetical protein